MEGKSGGRSVSLADARQSGPAGPLVEHPVRDRRVPARQPGSGKAKGLEGPTLIPSGAPPGARVERAKVSAVRPDSLRYVPFPSERAPETGAPVMQRSSGTTSPVKLRPAAAVIPAPIAYIKVVAVKKLVVEPWTWLICPPNRAHGFGRVFPSGEPYALHWV